LVRINPPPSALVRKNPLGELPNNLVGKQELGTTTRLLAMNPHECESCGIPLTVEVRRVRKKEILNVLGPDLAILVLLCTPFILLSGFSRTEH
jgi:hypothetical protein